MYNGGMSLNERELNIAKIPHPSKKGSEIYLREVEYHPVGSDKTYEMIDIREKWLDKKSGGLYWTKNGYTIRKEIWDMFVEAYKKTKQVDG